MTTIKEYEMCLESGQKLAIKEWGESSQPSIIALHGWLDNAGSFDRLAPRMGQYRIIAPDLPGHGLSDNRSGRYDIWENVADIAELMDNLGLAQAILLGHSMGAMIAALFAGTFPRRVKQLVLIDGLIPVCLEAKQAPLQLADSIRAGWKKERRRFASLEAALLARVNGMTKVSHRAAALLAKRGLVQVSNDIIYWRADPCLKLPSRMRPSHEQVLAFLNQITASTLLIAASQGVVGETLLKTWQGAITKLQVQWVSGSHHLHLEKVTSETVVALLLDFLQPQKQKKPKVL